MARTLIVSTLHISERVDTKLRNRDLDPEVVKAQIEGVGALPFSWDHDPNRGSRALVWTEIDDEAVLVVLYPSRFGDAQEWHLGSAYRDDPQT